MTTVLRASTNTTAATAYDSTKLNMKQFAFAGRHFGRYLVLHGKFTRGNTTMRNSSNT